MLEQRLAPLFLRLVSQYRFLKKTTEPRTVLDLPVEITSQRLHYMPRLPNTAIKTIAKGAVDANLDDMLTLSMMYEVGMGVPQSKKLAQSWACMSLVEQGSVDYNTAKKQLKQHLKELPNGEYSYPAVVDKIYNRTMVTYERTSPNEVPDGDYMLTPMLSGVRLFAIYRADRETGTCYLYDVRAGGVQGQRISFDVASHLSLPRMLGELRNKPTKVMYNETMEDYIGTKLDYFVVAGTLAIPSDKRALVKAAHPEVSSANDLFQVMVDTAGEPRKRPLASSEADKIKTEIKTCKAIVSGIKNGSLRGTLKVEYEELADKLRRMKGRKDERAQKLRNRRAEIKEQWTAIKAGTALTKAEKRLLKLKDKLSAAKVDEQNEKLVFLSKYPENLFDFIATDIYYGGKGKGPRRVPVGQQIDTHLSSLGFQGMTHPIFDSYRSVQTKEGAGFTASTFKSAMRKFKSVYPQYKVAGIVARNFKAANSVNKGKREELPTYIVTTPKG